MKQSLSLLHALICKPKKTTNRSDDLNAIYDGHCKISGRPKWVVADRYYVERDRFNQHRVTDRKTGTEYHVGTQHSGGTRMVESTYWRKGRRGTTCRGYNATQVLTPNGPTHKRICAVVDALQT